MAALPTPSTPDVLRDPHRIASARRLLVEVPGPAAFDRLSALAARLVGAGHAKVTLFTDQDIVVGGYGLPAGVVGGPALLTGALSAIVVREGTPLNIPDARANERVADLPAVTSGQVQAYLGAPIIAASGHIVGVLAVYDPTPRSWTGDATELLEQLSASVVAELELSAAQSAVGASSARLDVALEAGSVGIWERDLRTGSVFWDERASGIMGFEGAVQLDSLEQLMSHIHPEDHATVQQAMQTALAERGAFLAECRVLRTDGAVRWTVSRARVVADPSGEPIRVLGTVVDVTDAREQSARRLSAVQRAAAIAEVAAELANATRVEELADIAQRGGQVLGASSSALAVFDPGGAPLRLHMTHWLVDQARAGADVELPRDGIPIELDDELPTQWVARHGRRVFLATPEEARARFPRMGEISAVLGVQALAALPLRVESRVLGSFVVVWDTEHPFAGDDLEVLEALTAQIALSVSRLQADVERDAAVAAMTEANRHLQLLADVGEVLSDSLDIEDQIDRLTARIVPGIADWCYLVVTDEQGRPQQLAAAHRDPERRALVSEYVKALVAGASEEAALHVAVRSGQVVRTTIDQAYLDAVLPDPALRELFARLGGTSATVVPLTGRGRTLGALGLLNDPERGPHSDAEVDTLVEIGRRAGLALEHARLFGQQRALAETLQRSMLTAPPRPSGTEIVVRYVPAAAGAEIGGDWYDAFLQPDGCTVLAIGDVVGHDSRAAAAMGQVRGLLRGISYSSGDTPAGVLRQLDRAVRGLALDTMATCLVARLEPDDGAAGTTLRWSNAGHLPPAVLAPDGTVTLLDDGPVDLLLGVAPDTPRTDRVAVLPPGATVLLYTDGLVERRDRDLDAGAAELAEVLRRCAGLPLAELCDRVLERLFLPDAEDDVAVLAVRLAG
ncbi:SpoIIE family protein phosphatase [Petropleomorpha daqingensis]|uniref:PAS domain S-box-containing protein n=1 Tax=Petropleomorpha daqingensis TaxID=2026353 RepID=A0A853CIE0_9ACTN|nr:PAS domain S-box-containing protein [Petropleomorpha daqingensis]